jgi:hypothetical protein
MTSEIVSERSGVIEVNPASAGSVEFWIKQVFMPGSLGCDEMNAARLRIDV